MANKNNTNSKDNKCRAKHPAFCRYHGVFNNPLEAEKARADEARIGLARETDPNHPMPDYTLIHLYRKQIKRYILTRAILEHPTDNTISLAALSDEAGQEITADDLKETRKMRDLEIKMYLHSLREKLFTNPIEHKIVEAGAKQSYETHETYEEKYGISEKDYFKTTKSLGFKKRYNLYRTAAKLVQEGKPVTSLAGGRKETTEN